MGVRRGTGDSGTISIFVALSATMMMLFMGVVLDCGGRLRTLADADALAQEAARVGGQQIDQGSVLNGKGPLINPAAAYDAADAYLRPYGLHANRPGDLGQPTASLTIVVDTDYQTTLLGLFGVSTLHVQGTGTATLVSGDKKAGGA